MGVDPTPSLFAVHERSQTRIGTVCLSPSPPATDDVWAVGMKRAQRIRTPRFARGVRQMTQRSGEVELAAHDRITGVCRITVDRLERDVDDTVLVEVDAVRHEECP